MAASGNGHSLITPLEMIRQKSDLVTPFELLRETAKSPTRPHKTNEPRSLLGLSTLPPAPQPKSSPSGSSSASPPSSPHDIPPQTASVFIRRKSDPKVSSPLALSAIRCEDVPSPPMSPTSPTRANDSNGARPSSPKPQELGHLRRIAVERSRKSTRIISFLDTVAVAPKLPPRSSPPIVPPPNFLGISRRRTRSFAVALSPALWSAADTLALAGLVERFDHWVSMRQEAPPPLVRQRTRTMAFSSSPLALFKHKRCLSLPNDFSLRAAESLILSESAPLIGSALNSSSSGGSAVPSSPPPSPSSKSAKSPRSKKEKKVKKEKSHSRSQERLPSSDELSPRAQDSPSERRPSSDPIIEAADLHSYIATLLAPKSGLMQQSFKDSLDWILTAYRNYATPVELGASLHVLWTFCAASESPETQAHEQNVMYTIGRWITLNYESEFLLENGLPDAASQKALAELISRAPESVQFQFRQMIEEQQREVKQYSVMTIQPRKKGKVPMGLKKADFNLVALIDPSDLARCFTLLDWDLMIKVRRVDMLSKAYPQTGKGMNLTALAQVTAKWNAVQTWVTAEIVTAAKLKQRTALLERFIVLAATLLDEQQNYHTFFAVMLGMKDASVYRMKGTWKRLSSNMVGLFAKLDRLTDLTGGYKVYRASVKELRRQKITAIVPFMVVPISDLVMLGHVPDHVEVTGAVNWAKTTNVGRVLADFEDMRRACRKSLSEALWTEADVAVMRMLPPLRVERFEMLSDDFLFGQSKLHEPSVML